MHTRLGPAFATAHRNLADWWLASRPRPAVVAWRPGDDPWNATEVELDLAGAAGGPLTGVAVAVKSTIAIAGVPLAAGSKLVDGHVPVESATVVERVLAAGGRITHTGRTDDLCLAITGDQAATGPVLNPWSSRHTTWGSSAGAAALVAAGRAQAAVLVDQAGSGRVPGAGCGLVVLLPTRGLIPMTGILGFTPVQDRVAVGARDTATVARLGSVLTGGDGRDLKQGPHPRVVDWASSLTADMAGLRIGVVSEAFTDEMCDPAVAAVLRGRIAHLANLGAEVREVSIPRYRDAVDLAMVVTVHGGVPDMLVTHLGSAPSVLHGDPELTRQVAFRRAEHPSWLPETARVSATAAGHDGGQPSGYWLAMAMGLIPALVAAFDAPLQGADAVDVLVTPTVHSTPPTVPTDDMTRDEVLGRALGPGIWHTCALNLTGHPAAQVPAGVVEGLPVGLQVIAPHLGEDRCLRVAAALEPAGGFPMAPTRPRRPADSVGRP